MPRKWRIVIYPGNVLLAFAAEEAAQITGRSVAGVGPGAIEK
jgi:hypothetical protein